VIAPRRAFRSGEKNGDVGHAGVAVSLGSLCSQAPSTERRGVNSMAYCMPELSLTLRFMRFLRLRCPHNAVGYQENYVMTSKKRTTVIRYYHTNQIGMPWELTNLEGGIQQRARYEAWGHTHTLRLDEPDYANLKESTHQPLRFQGQYFDAETGLHYNRHRYYDPGVGRFMTPDPIGLAGDINLYRYAPNPTRWSDPLGLQGVDLNLLSRADFMCDVMNIHEPTPGYFTAALHGSPDGTLQAFGRDISPHELAQRIKRSGKYKDKMPVKLLACYGGKGTFAQNLANELNTNVFASTGFLIARSDPNFVNTTVFVAHPETSCWMKFPPQ
jgi:RHS repeat-associated protein